MAEPAVRATVRAVRDSLAFSRSQKSLADSPPHPLLPLSDGCTLKRKHLDSSPKFLITEQSFNYGRKKHAHSRAESRIRLDQHGLDKEKNVKILLSVK